MAKKTPSVRPSQFVSCGRVREFEDRRELKGWTVGSDERQRLKEAIEEKIGERTTIVDTSKGRNR
jgi:hypothetical protein